MKYRYTLEEVLNALDSGAIAYTDDIVFKRQGSTLVYAFSMDNKVVYTHDSIVEYYISKRLKDIQLDYTHILQTQLDDILE